MRYQTLVFDLDGTIMKTDEGVVLALQYAANRLGLQGLPYDRPELFIGPSNIWFCTEHLGLDMERAIAFDHLMVEEYGRVSEAHSQVFDGMIELLRDASAAGYRCFVCTAKNEAAAIHLGEVFGFGAHVEATVGSIDGTEEKVDLLRRLIESYGLDPTQTAMIGDRYTDLDGGRQNGTRTVGVLYGYGPREEIESCRPDAIAADVAGLRAHLLHADDGARSLASIPNVLFDLDGTIVASAPGIQAGIRHAAGIMGIEVSLEDTRRYIGPPMERFAREGLGLKGEDAERFVKIFRAYYAERGVLECPPYPGMVALLHALHDAGRKIFLCTSKPQPMAVRALEPIGVLDCFDGVVGAVEGRREKAALLAYALESCRIDPNEAVMIGDRDLDLLAAKACGTHAIGALYGYGDLEELQAAQPDAIAESVADLARLLLG